MRRNSVSGIVHSISTRVAKSGQNAHGFKIDGRMFTFFTDDPMHPLVEGDMIRVGYIVRQYKTGSRRKYNVADLETLLIDSSAESVDSSDKTDVGSGTIYILSNPSMYGLLKIGYTTRNVLTRVQELSTTTSVPRAFKLEWALPVARRAAAVEAVAHGFLHEKREGKEFFRASLDEAQSAIRLAYLHVAPEDAARHDEALAARSEEIAEMRRTRSERVEKWQHEKAELKRRQAELKRHKAWLRSSDAHRRLRVAISWWLEDFDEALSRGAPSLLLRLIGKKNPDYLDIWITFGKLDLRHSGAFDTSEDQERQWYIRAFGSRFGVCCTEPTLNALTWQDALVKVNSLIQEHPARNRRVTVSVLTANLRNPDYGAGSKRPVDPSVVSECLARMEVVQENENGAGPPPDWKEM